MAPSARVVVGLVSPETMNDGDMHAPCAPAPRDFSHLTCYFPCKLWHTGAQFYTEKYYAIPQSSTWGKTAMNIE
jgi:hypothetical protein